MTRSPAALAVLLFAFSSAAAQQTDVIRGRISDPDGAPVENATITATSISGNVNRTARTDKGGRYTITFPDGDGDYMISIAALGFAAKRFEVKRVADEDFLVADARLQRVNAVLDAVEVRAARQRPRRDEGAPDASGTERTIAPSDVPANLLGDLAAMAATLPGVESVTNPDGSAGYSVLGLDSDQNSMTLNGMAFDGSMLPRDAAVSTSLVTSPYDVSRGGFSGGQLSIRARGGSNFISRTNSLNFDSPAMQWTDPAARSLGREYTNASLGGMTSGPIAYDRAFYNLSYQLGRRSSDFESLLTADATGLQAAGVAADSVTRLADISARLRIPQTIGGLRDDRIGDNGTVFGVIDLTSPSAASGTALNFTFNGAWSRQDPAGGSSTEMPAFGGERTSWRFGLQARHSNYYGIGILTETSLGLNLSRNYGTPYLDLPAGRVRVSSSFADGTDAVEVLSFGGNPSMRASATTASTQFQNQMSWFSGDNKHRIKLTTDLRHETIEQDLATNTLGTFTYNSLADLDAGSPASFSRQLSPRRRELSALVGAVAIGDAYRARDNLQLTYGLRLDGTRFLDRPVSNPALTVFSLENDRVPDRVYLSPRAGFSWTYGTAPQIASFAGAVRDPRAVVRGGIGVFQSVPGSNLIGAAIDNTGLPDAVQQVTCVGSAAPVPDWAAYAADPSLIPSACADGSAGTPFADIAPAVTAFARDYVSPRSLRSNLQWSGPALGNRFATSIDFTWSVNLNQPSTVDRNFSGVSRFAVANEAGRPVYVQSTSIVPSTGSIASADARITPAFSRVTENRSDLRSDSYQASLRVSPITFSTGFTWSAWYTHAIGRQQFRGFASTDGNPLEVSWGPSPVSRHQIGYSLGYNFLDFLRLNWFGQFRSGRPFTPSVAGDVNGDGYSNDRAFIFDPDATSDTAVAGGMRALLDGAGPGTRECLSRQLGTIASRYSCDGPWTSTATLSLSFNPLKVRMPQRASLSFQLSNPFGAADLVLNGPNNLRGWGQTPVPDASLLYVRGFDPATQRYRYEVNRRFGATSPALSQLRSPVTLTALLRFDLGPTRERQMLTQQLDRGRRRDGDKAPEMLLRAMFGNGGIPNPLATILRDQDTLALSSEQADSIATLNRQYVIKLNELWSPIVKEFASLPDDYDHDAAYQRYIVARRQTVDLLRSLAPTVKSLLAEDQLRRLPPFVAGYLDARYLASIRSGTAGLNAGRGPTGGFIPAGADVFATGAGGGGNVRIELHRP